MDNNLIGGETTVLIQIVKFFPVPGKQNYYHKLFNLFNGIMI